MHNLLSMKYYSLNRITFIIIVFLGSTGDFLTAQSTSLYVYDDDHSFWFPSGWMPDGNGIHVNPNSTIEPFSGSSCIELKIALNKSSAGWAGVYWLTHDSWKGPGVNIYEELGVTKETPIKLSFRIRGAEGGERVQFKVGGISEGNDSLEFPISSSWKVLSTEWVRYEMDFSNQNLTNVVGGFCVVTNKPRNPRKSIITLYLDKIQFEVISQ